MTKIVRKTTSGAIQLSPNFYLTEFTNSDQADRLGIVNAPDPLATQNLFKTAALMEQVRSLLGSKVISVSSGFRCMELNTAIGSGPTSQHLTGEACDFNCFSFGTAKQVAQKIADSKIEFGQLIYEGSWVHISTPTEQHKRQVMTAVFKKGEKTAYVPGIV